MKIPPLFTPRPESHGNPAEPSLAEREKIVAKENKKTGHDKKSEAAPVPHFPKKG